MKKRILSVLLLLCGTLCANAAVKYMTVEQTSGAKYSFLLADNPVVTYVDDNLVVNGNASTSYALTSVAKFYFTEESEATVVAKVETQMLRVLSLDENTLRVENAEADAKVTLVRLDGVMVLMKKTDKDGSATVSLPTAQSVYVLTVGNQSFKLIRK